MPSRKIIYCKMLFIISKLGGSIDPIDFTFPDRRDRKVFKILLRRKLVKKSLDGVITITSAGHRYLKKHGDLEKWTSQTRDIHSFDEVGKNGVGKSNFEPIEPVGKFGVGKSSEGGLT